MPDRLFKWFACIYILLGSYWYRNNLTKLAILYGCEKWGNHYYTPHYQRHFNHYKRRRLKLLEIGIGGYKHADKGGESLRMWRSFFRKAGIFGIDIYDKSFHDERRIKTRRGSQVDREFLQSLIEETGGFDIIIDDGSHLNAQVIASFEFLFPFLHDGGMYVIEDTQTSYWPRYGGADRDLNTRSSTMGFFKALVDGLNYEEYRIVDYQPTYYDQNIREIHFYHNLIFIKKGKNAEGSNMLGRQYE
jgi:hypothetical protein